MNTPSGTKDTRIGRVVVVEPRLKGVVVDSERNIAVDMLAAAGVVVVAPEAATTRPIATKLWAKLFHPPKKPRLLHRVRIPGSVRSASPNNIAPTSTSNVSATATTATLQVPARLP